MSGSRQRMAQTPVRSASSVRTTSCTSNPRLQGVDLSGSRHQVRKLSGINGVSRVRNPRNFPARRICVSRHHDGHAHEMSGSRHRMRQTPARSASSAPATSCTSNPRLRGVDLSGSHIGSRHRMRQTISELYQWVESKG